jgi:hypothetical protein
VPFDALDRLVELLLPVLHDEQQRRRVIGRVRPVLKGRPRGRPRLRRSRDLADPGGSARLILRPGRP